MDILEEIRALEGRFSRSPDSRLFLPLADALRRAGERQRAIRLCSEGLEKFPDSGSARMLLAECLEEEGRTGEAAEHYRRLREQDGENVEVLHRLARLAQHEGRVKEALALERQAQQLEFGGRELAVQTLEISADRLPVQVERDDDPDGGLPELPETPGESAAVEEELSGDTFLTESLADIYRLQGHREQAARIYRTLLEQDSGREDLRRKLREVTGADAPPPATATGAAPDFEEFAATAGAGIERRIDNIFQFLMGETDALELEGATVGAGSAERGGAGQGKFLELVERWLADLRSGKERR